MKFFVAAFALAAAVSAEPEADPALLYANAGYVAPATAYAAGYTGYPNTYAAGYASPLAYGAYPWANGFAYSSLAAATPFYNNYFGARLLKREAEAEPEADPALLYNGAFAAPYATAYNYGYAAAAPFAYGAGFYNNFYGLNAAAVYAHAAPAAVPAVPGGYAAAGRYVANSAGVVHVAKREAEAEADPALLYAGAGYGYAAPLTAAAYAAPLATTAYASPLAATYTATLPYYNNAYSFGYSRLYNGIASPYFGRFYY